MDANSHPIKVKEVTNAKFYANKHPYKVKVVGGGGGGTGVKVLTSEDYNWPTSGTKTGVALWLLEPGLYTVRNTSTAVYSNKNTTASYLYGFRYWMVYKASGASYITIYGFGSPTQATTVGYKTLWIETVQSDGTSHSINSVLTPGNIRNELTFTGEGYTLDARQGKVLKDLIDARVPEPTAGDADKFLKGDGTWATAGGGGGTTEDWVFTMIDGTTVTKKVMIGE